MKLCYYPGCTMKNAALNFEESALYALAKLDIEVDELKKWYCCGTVFSLTTDNLIQHVGPVRNLLRVQETGNDSVMTLCAMCFNTLKRANERMKSDPESLEKINEFMSHEDTKYTGRVKVLHLLELLRDSITFDRIAQKIERPLHGLRVAAYYGCMLVRPQDIGIDDQENPTVMEELLKTLGATPVEFPYKTECCGAYLTVNNPEMIVTRTHQIVGSALRQGADVIAVACPLCAFNLDHRQKQTAEKHLGFQNIPVVYFTQLMAAALGGSEDDLRLDLHHVDPRPLFKEKKVI